MQTGVSRDSGVAGEALAAALGAVRGNEACADCGASGPEWASLNLGVLLCAPCSGVHRHMGVHISKASIRQTSTKPPADYRCEICTARHKVATLRVLLCAPCSGVHRRMGVHISRVVSL